MADRPRKGLAAPRRGAAGGIGDRRERGSGLGCAGITAECVHATTNVADLTRRLEDLIGIEVDREREGRGQSPERPRGLKEREGPRRPPRRSQVGERPQLRAAQPPALRQRRLSERERAARGENHAGRPPRRRGGRGKGMTSAPPRTRRGDNACTRAKGTRGDATAWAVTARSGGKHAGEWPQHALERTPCRREGHSAEHRGRGAGEVD